MSKNGTISAKQAKAVEALLAFPNVTDAAAAAGVGQTTIYRWMQQPDFVSELRRRQRLVLDGVTAKLTAMATEAADVYLDGIRDESISVRLKAAGDLFAHLLKLSELVSLQARMEEIEEMLSNEH